MKNKNKKTNVPAIPNEILKLTLVQGKDGEFYKFPSKSHVHLTDENVNIQWDGWVEFHERTYKTKEGVELYHRITGKKVPKNFTPEDISMHIWHGYITKAHDRTVRPQPEAKEGVVSRKSLDGRVYSLLDPDFASKVMPPQAKACLTILRDTLKDGQVTEGDLKAAIESRSAEIKTKQDPWRIFQYYRANMIANKIIRAL